MNGWSLDSGITRSNSFIGISKDIIKNNKIEIDIGTGITKSKELFLGIHATF
jgi:hypothetical protein